MSCLEPTVVFMLPLLKTRNKQSSKLKILKYDLFHIPDRVESEIGDCDYPLIAGDGFCDDEVELVSKELNHLAAILHFYAGGLNFMK